MNPSQRIRACRLIEKMNKNREFNSALGLVDMSSFHGKTIKEYQSHHEKTHRTQAR